LNVFYKTANTNLSLDKKQLYANTLGSFYLIDLESNKIQYNVNNKAIRTLEENLNSAITDISVLNNSNVIISTLASLSEYNSAFKLIRSTDISLTNDTIALSNESIMSIFELDGQSVLLKSLHQKLYYWNTKTNTVIETSLHEPVSNVIVHDSLIWIATSKSISSYKWVDGDLVKQLDMINENDIKDFVFDKNGNIWYTNGTYLKGVSKTGSVIYSFLNFAVKLDGLISNIVCVDLDGKLIVSSDKKLVALDISNYSFLTSLNKEIKISAIYELEGNKKVNISRLNKNPIQLPYAQNFIEIQFSPTDYNFLDNLYYEYRLDSESSSWLKTTDNRVVLSFLKSGRYNFEVRGVFPDGTVSKAQMLPFTVLAPFWQTPWFRVFIILLIISILGLVVFIRENKRRAVLQIQNKLAANIHDDLGTSLAKVSIYAELLSQNKDLSHYDKLKKMIKEIKQSVSDSSWVIDSNEATLNDLIQRIRLMHRESCQAVESECVQLIEITNGKMRLNSSDKENLYLLLKELITNCIKYTQSMEMLLEIVQTKNKIEIRLKNEYSYIKERSTDMGGKGKANIQLRIKQLKGQVFSMDDNFFHMEVRL
jgi:signal transduction histidine kinase